MPAYDEKYIKVKIREFNGVIKTSFLGGEEPREGMHCICVSVICVLKCF